MHEKHENILASKGMGGAKAILKERVLEPRVRILWWWLWGVCRSLPGGLVSLGWLSMGLAPCEILLQISIPKKNFVFFVFFEEKNRTLISDLTQSNFKVLLTKGL